VFAECFVQTGAFFYILVHFAKDALQLGVFCLRFQDFQHIDHGNPGVEHGSELLGEKNQFGCLYGCQQFPDSGHLEAA
jgi:hypothetical protein